MASNAVLGLLMMSLVYIFAAEHRFCKVVPLLELMEEEMKDALNEYKSQNGAEITAWPKKFPQLHLKLKSVDDQKAAILCGVNYTMYALRSILAYQEHLHYNKKQLLGNLTYINHRMHSHVKTCLEHELHTHCEEHTEPNPAFPTDSHNAGKRWGLAALEHVQKFLQDLTNVMKTRPTTK